MKFDELATQLVKDVAPILNLGDELYEDVWRVAEGKLRDRKPVVYQTIGEKKVVSQIAYALKNMLEKASPPIIKQTADHYRVKYPD